MNTPVITVNNEGSGFDEALALSEKLGLSCGLDKKQNLRLRLLTEELFGLVRNIAGELNGSFSIEYEGRSFILSLDANVNLTSEMREQFLSVSSSGENEAAVGFMGKICDMISSVLLSTNSNSTMLQAGLMCPGAPSDAFISTQNYEWYLKRYRDSVDGTSNEDARDDLERSIVANIADDISIRIIGSTVGVRIYKIFT